MKIFWDIIFLLLFFGCNSQEKNKKNGVGVNNFQKKNSYECEHILLALNNDTLTGVFQYYDRWDSKEKQYRDINVFYFFGKKENNDKINIVAGFPDDFLLNGSIKIGDTIEVFLNDQPNGYAAYDFSEEGYKCGQITEKMWLKLGIVKNEKVYFYDSFDSKQKGKIYIVKGDIVKVVEMKNTKYKVEYSPPSNPKKVYIGWINFQDIYDVDPKKWDDKQK